MQNGFLFHLLRNQIAFTSSPVKCNYQYIYQKYKNVYNFYTICFLIDGENYTSTVV